MRNFLLSVKKTHLVDCWKIRRQSSMNAEDSPVDNSSERQEVKSLIKIFPTVGVAILFVDLIEEAVHHGDVSTLVISSEQVDTVWIAYLKTKEQCNGLH